MLLIACVAGGCATTDRDAVMSGSDPIPLRAYQSRSFAEVDRIQLLRGVIATLQDLAFVIDEADETLGIVSGTRLSATPLRISILVDTRRDGSSAVRANAFQGTQPIETPEPYQDFFNALQKTLFLEANGVD
jgi:hypothetical protein